MDKFFVTVLLMAIVTYLPRMIPMVVLNELKLSSRFNSFLQFIPYAVLGALIFPGFLYSTNSINSALAGGITAIVLSFLRINIVFVVIGSIIGVYIINIL